MRKRKQSLIMVVVILVLFLGLGYAYLSTTLNINGTTDVDSNTWNVFWNNVQVKSGSVTGSQVTQAPTISNSTTVSFRVNLKNPGEFYEFTVDAKNTGSIDAMIDTITKTTNIPAYLKFDVTYDDGVPIENNHKLSSNSTQKYKVRVEYRTDINPNQLPSSSQSVSINFGSNYVQANSNAVEKPYYLYFNDTSVPGQTIDNITGSTLYNSYNDLINALGVNYFTRHLIRDNTIVSSQIGFVLNGKDYYLSGLGESYSSSNYNINMAILNEAFGESHCLTDNSNYYSCTLDNNFYAGSSGDFSGITVNGGTVCEIVTLDPPNNGYVYCY